MTKNAIFYFIVFMFLLTSCKKDEAVGFPKSSDSNETIIQDSLMVFSGGSYKMDLTNDNVNDIEFNIHGYHSPSGYEKMEYYLILHNPQFKAYIISKNDTFCLDSVSYGGFNGTYLHNCSSTNNFNSVDTAKFVPLVDENKLTQTSNYNFLYDDTTLIYRSESLTINSGLAYPNYFSSNVSHGAFISISEGYIVVEAPDGKRKAILIKSEIPYLIIEKVIGLD